MVNIVVKKFKNGNLSVKLERSEFKNMTLNDIFEAISDELFWYDCYFVGEPFCISNYGEGCYMHDASNDNLILVPFSQLCDLVNGKRVKFYARKCDERDREELNL